MASWQVFQQGWHADRLAGSTGVSGVSDWFSQAPELHLRLYADDLTYDTAADSTVSDLTGTQTADEIVPVDSSASGQVQLGQGIYVNNGDLTLTFSSITGEVSFGVLYEDGADDTERELVALANYAVQNPSSQDVDVTFTNGAIATFTYS
jgi:hypothetical protein